MDRFGDKVYNSYNATEAGQISIATRPTCGTLRHGRPPGHRYDAATRRRRRPGRPVGEVGRIVVKGASEFDGYTTGDTKASLDGFMVSGDVGRMDADGRLYVVGRDDDMIVSGGENVYPVEVERTIGELAEVREVVVVGVDDEKFGQRLAAYVVPASRRPSTPTRSRAREGPARGLQGAARRGVARRAAAQRVGQGSRTRPAGGALMVMRMRGADAGFLYMETPSMHMHTLKIAVIEQHRDLTFDNLVTGDARRLRRMPALQQAGGAGAVRAQPPVARDPTAHRPRTARLPARPGRLGDLAGRRGRDGPDRRAAAGSRRPAVGDPRLRGARRRPGRRRQDPPRAGRRQRRQRDARQHHRHPLRRAGPPLTRDPDADTRCRRGPTGIRASAGRDARRSRCFPACCSRPLRGLRSHAALRRNTRPACPLPIADTPRISFNGPLTPRGASRP